MMELSSVINDYLSRGFGSMNKNDFEVWIFNFLLQEKLKGKSNFEISIELKIPEQKVKRLKYEAELKCGSPDKSLYAKHFSELLSKVHLKKDGSCVQFVVEDIQLRKYLDSLLKKDGRFSNTSFNTEIVSIDPDDLEFLMKAMFPNEDWNRLYSNAKSLLNTDKVTFSGLFKKFAESAVGEAGKKFIDLSFAGILAMI